MKKKLLAFLKNKTILMIMACIVLVLLITAAFGIASLNNVSLTCEEASDIALKKLGAGTAIKCEQEGRKYEVKIINKNYEYEFIIDGNTGTIVQYDSDDLND